jgi:predicted ferric reductase
MYKLFKFIITFANCILISNSQSTCFTNKDIINNGYVTYETNVYDIKNYKHPFKIDLSNNFGKPLEINFNKKEYSFHKTSKSVKSILSTLYIGKSCNKNLEYKDEKEDYTNHIVFGTSYSFFLLVLVSSLLINKFCIKSNHNILLYIYYLGYTNMYSLIFYIFYFIFWVGLLVYSLLDKDDILVRLGLWNSVNLSITLFPALRNFCTQHFINKHKVIAIFCFISMIVKFVFVIVKNSLQNLYNNESNILASTSLISMILIIFFSLPFIREYNFELFLYTHRILSILIILFAILHKIETLYYVIPSFILYIIDILLRIINTYKVLYCKFKNVGTNNENTSSILITLETNKTLTKYTGCYFYLCVNNISFLQWHPLSLIEQKNNQLLFCAKVFGGKNSWTNKLKKLDNSVINKEILLSSYTYIQGPYCHLNIDYNQNKYKFFIFIAGGIGITPFFSILKDIDRIHNKLDKLISIILIWIIPHQSLFYELYDFLIKTNSKIKIIVYVTKSTVDYESGDVQVICNKPLIEIHYLRPYINSVMCEFYNTFNTESKYICVACCGSKSIIKDTLETSYQLGISNFFDETFS